MQTLTLIPLAFILKDEIKQIKEIRRQKKEVIVSHDDNDDNDIVSNSSSINTHPTDI